MVTLLEPGASATEAARAFPIQVVRGYADDYYPEEQFDVLFAAHVVEHVPDLNRFLASCYRLLRPGGRLLLLTPNALAWKLAHFRSGWAWAAPGEHTHLLTPQSAQIVLERAGFNVLTLKTAIPFWRHYPFFLTRQLSFLLTRLIGRSPTSVNIPSSTNPTVCSPAGPAPRLGWKHYLRRSGRVVLWAEYLTLSVVDRLVGLKRADELLIVAQRPE
jgi:SAM-dependent methyltransferase